MNKKKPIRHGSTSLTTGAQGKPKYKIRKVAGRRVYLDTNIYYDPRIRRARLYVDSDRIVVRGRKGEKRFALARYVMKAKKGELVDHRNRNFYDNRRENLQIATVRENNLNRILKNKTGCMGVNIHIRITKKGRRYPYYYGHYRYGGKQHHLYTPFTRKGLKLAALARDKFVLEAGDEEFAPLNFPIFKNDPFKTILLRSDLNEYKQTISAKK
ncbi:MAG: hypothetical protein CVV39_04175 [Planctomycetes bacterium HGW-Planctomycetes-1]|nr:MAG: hypothetical protein CVV39_04175 [Planctomycetes bacterium HGW-Planctomycetes-1]